MSEWSKEPDSKSGVGLVLTVGSNPTHSEKLLTLKFISTVIP